MKTEESILAAKRTQTLQSIRGMNDILPSQSPYWHLLEKTCREIAEQYAYQEIRFPLVELTNLFKRTIGSATDIVEKEMYTFIDRDGDSLSLRPEGTAGCVRAGIEQGLLHNQIQRFWYLGPMFRHERPQKGRYRQFHQFGVEAFGLPGPAIDVEQILLTKRIWEKLDLAEQMRLEINSLGTFSSRQTYRDALINYFKKHKDQLDEDSRNRLELNPLRILDSKNPNMQDLIHHAPKITEYLDEFSQQHFAGLRRLLDMAQIEYVVNPYIVRGLDYYCLTVYEWITTALGAQGTVCAGGRYDALVEQLGGKPTPAVGFALGLERTILLLQQKQSIKKLPLIYGIFVGEAATQQGLLVAEKLRSTIDGLSIDTGLADGNFKKQFKRADKSGAQWALIIGADELATGKIGLKDLRNETPQQSFTVDELIQFFQQKMAREKQ